ncbi:hypothetical protein PACTADRAFT_69967 [Pachysolen tannophilus NRRL Y-2460]|uniref:Protein kish n=1 Tax=Pachysolen tannophilus NRRL Y-2460 TaxID=669874 RepID=A0A1E4TT26_PACTA|nr:hypothetical protein PACTADRAFT_69967 [Pachysolen tannophilus NRRL Y-2460]
MSALLNLTSLLQVFLLVICTSTYLHGIYPSIMDSRKHGLLGIFWKSARIGERLSPYVSISCILFAINQLIS